MAGYLMGLDNVGSLRLYVKHGIYATKLPQPGSSWLRPHEGTFADYATMQPGDNIYFFIDRRVYGIGELTRVGFDCKFQNFAGAGIPITRVGRDDAKRAVWSKEEGFLGCQRWVCTFRPHPRFFIRGLDMDDLLSSKPAAFRMLRAFWKLSFIKFDDEENQAFRDAILRRNEDLLTSSSSDAFFSSEWEENHGNLAGRVSSSDHRLTVAPILDGCAEGDKLKHEMAIEAGILTQLALRDPHTTEVFGAWDYVHHQVPASPFKPIDYMDRMDVFGYAFLPNHRPTRSRYLVIEIKKDQGSTSDVEQLMKYVDWVKDEYASGDYGMIRAFLVAHEFHPECRHLAAELCKRRYIVGRRPPESREWKELRLVRYRYDASRMRLRFEEESF